MPEVRSNVAVAARFVVTILLTAIVSLNRPHPASADATCLGDCHGVRAVSTDDLVTLAGIALGHLTANACAMGIGAQPVTVAAILAAVDNAVTPCRPFMTPTATPTSEPTATPTGGIAVPAVAAGSAIVASAMTVLPNVVGAIVTGVQLTGGVANVPNASDPCTLHGMAMRAGQFPPSTTLTFSDGCEVPTSNGSVVLDGTATINLELFTVDIEMTFKQSGAATVTEHASIGGTVDPSLSPPCLLTGAMFVVSDGTVTAQTPGGQEVGVQFDNTSVSMDSIMFDTNCGLERYTLTFDDHALLMSSAGTPIDTTFNTLFMDVDQTNPTTAVFLHGGFSSPCFGGAVSLLTQQAVALSSDGLCPSAGTIVVGLPLQGQATITFRSDMSVDVDINGDGTTDLTAQTCLDNSLLMCLP